MSKSNKLLLLIGFITLVVVSIPRSNQSQAQSTGSAHIERAVEASSFDTIKANALVDKAGTGAPSFTNGLTAPSTGLAASFGDTSGSDHYIQLRNGVGGFFGWDDSANNTIIQSPNTRGLNLKVSSDTFSAGVSGLLIEADGAVTIPDAGGNGGNVPHNCARTSVNACNSTTTCNKSCAVGQILTGGGCYASGSSIRNAYPSGLEWRCEYISSTNIEAMAVCCDY